MKYTAKSKSRPLSIVDVDYHNDFNFNIFD